MSAFGSRRSKAHRQRAAAAHYDGHFRRQPVEVVVEDMFANTLLCRHGDCLEPAARWYVRSDLTPDARRLDRVIVFPACLPHAERVEAASCDDEGCLAPPGDHEYLSAHDDLVPVLHHALSHEAGIGWPDRQDATRLDVIRPARPGHAGIA
jgi:hypothetical protein